MPEQVAWQLTVDFAFANLPWMPSALPANLKPLDRSRDVMVTGLGMVTALGCGWRVNADGFRSGDSGIRAVTLFDTSGFNVHRAGEVALPERIPTGELSPGETRRLERGGRMLLLAADEAARQAGIGVGTQWRDFDVVIGTSAGAMTHGENFYREAMADHRGADQASRAASYLMGRQAGLVARAHGLTGESVIISNACASGANAIGQARQMIVTGRAERVLAGGYDALCELVFGGFDSLKALSRTTPRPFDAQRDGLALGEGAAMLVLESRASAEARGAEILAVVAGYGFSTDCHHLTQPHPEGDAAFASMTMACRDAGVEPAAVQYINSHGTGTPLNDPAEAAAIRRWAGEEVAAGIAVSSTKGAIGHVLGGAGAIEAAICVLALHEAFLPPTAHTTTVDPCCCFDLVLAPRAAELDCVLTNSFGFGGSNASLVFRKEGK
ncbi:MAG: beta-ketoacyl-[acyl-carrier-protein] synthase family protein [Verrucomicrobiales bacterium]